MTNNGKNKLASSAEVTGLANFYNEMSNNLRDMVRSTTTLEDKIKALVDTQDDLADKIEKLVDSYNNLLSRIINVEAKDLDNILTNINSSANRLAVLEHEVELVDDLSILVNRHEGTLAVFAAETKELKDKVLNQGAILQDLVLKMERLNLHKSNSDKIWDYVFKAIMAVAIAYIIYILGIKN